MSSQSASGVLVTVTKSAVMKTLTTPSISSKPAAAGSSGVSPAEKVAGPPTGLPTVNFIALGFGVGSVTTLIVRSSLATAGHWSGRP